MRLLPVMAVAKTEKVEKVEMAMVWVVAGVVVAGVVVAGVVVA